MIKVKHISILLIKQRSMNTLLKDEYCRNRNQYIIRILYCMYLYIKLCIEREESFLWLLFFIFTNLERVKVCAWRGYLDALILSLSTSVGD